MIKLLNNLLEGRQNFIMHKKGGRPLEIKCDENSLSGAVSQRACVYCGARVVLNPITDALHIVHGPIGCAAYTWDIRGSLSSGSELYRNSFSTDLREKNIIFGGERKLEAAIEEAYIKHQPKVIFVYATCVVGVIGDDIEAVCRGAEKKFNIRVIPVQSPGFSGNKKSGYKAGCNAILNLMSTSRVDNTIPYSINYLGDFNLAAESWIIKSYFDEMGVKLITAITGDSSYDSLLQAPRAKLNVVQCAGSMTYLAKQMQSKYQIPFYKVRFLGVDETVDALLKIAHLMDNDEIIQKTKKLIERKLKEVEEVLKSYREKVKGNKAAIYVGGGFKAIALIKQFNNLGIDTVVIGTQTGDQEEYEMIRSLTKDGTVILDDTNPNELQRFIAESGANILVGGVKERPLAYKLGLAFIDHNHERKHALSGFEGAINFAKEVALSVNSPVWDFVNG